MQNVLLVSLCDGIEYSIKVSKIIQVCNVAKTRLISPDNSAFLSPEILNSLCIVGNTHIPVISPEKILHHKRIEPLWQDQNNNRPIAHGHKSVANDTGMSFVPGIVCTVCVIIVLQVMDVLVKRARNSSRTILPLLHYVSLEIPANKAARGLGFGSTTVRGK